ncbi:MAG: tetratricopeptide repeat protein [Planctomycetota bacterium]
MAILSPHRTSAMFGKKKSPSTPPDGNSGNGNGGNGSAPPAAGDDGMGEWHNPRKASRFFDHAETVADARNFDYAVRLYANGLLHDPDNLAKHEALHDAGKRRKALANGKPAGMFEGNKFGSNSAGKMAHAARIAAMDPLNPKLLRDLMKHCVTLDEEFDALHMGDVAYWAGDLAMEFNTQQKKPDRGVYKDLCALFPKIGRFDRAVEACRYLLRMKPDDGDLQKLLKDLEAENTMQKAGYSDGKKVEEGGFRQFVRDADKQTALEQDDSVSQLKTRADEIIERRRAEYEEDPEDIDKLAKLVQALVAKEQPETEEEAMRLLEEAHERTGQYRYKVQQGDVRIKQLNRDLRAARNALTQKRDDPALKEQYQQAVKRKLVFEIKEYSERVKKYPTDLALKYELGRRMYQAGKIEEAISLLQEAKRDPKHRAVCHQYLGECYLKKGWLDEAVDTLREGKEAHRIPDDKLAKELLYLQASAELQLAERDKNLETAKAAQQTASSLLQMDIKYKDIQQLVNKVRELANNLREG